MKLYSGTSPEFIRDSVRNQIAEKLKTAFFTHFRYYPSKAEIGSWQNSLQAMAQVVQYAELDRCGVFLEYQLPQSSKRLDCMLTGQTADKLDSAIIVELKQWEVCSSSDGENEVATWVGGSVRDVLHPSAQVGQYRNYWKDSHTAFYAGEHPIDLEACAYLHNYRYGTDDELLSSKFERQREQFPVFSADEVDALSNLLSSSVSHGEGFPVLDRIERGEYRPSMKLMQHVSEVIKRNSNYVLLDEQLVVFDKVLAAAQCDRSPDAKRVLLINGGPGTGKSVIALNLMAELLAQGFNAHYATGSRAFTETLRKVIGARGAVQFKYFNSYMSPEAKEIDVLICDEAHRIRESSNNRYTRKSDRSDARQIQELMNAARVGVYFIDDDQVVRPGEIGSTEIIREEANGRGIEVLEFELQAQFRCGGSAAFVNWVNNTLGESPRVLRRLQPLSGLPPVWWTLPSYDSSIGGSDMNNQRFSPEFKDEAVRQIVDRGYSVAEVSERLGVSAHSLYKWVKAVKPDKTDEQVAALIEARSEVLKLRAQLRRTEEERDILKNRLRGLPRPMQSETRGATLSCVRTEAVSFLEALTPSKNLAQGKLRTRCWWRDSRPRLGM